jgi:sugar phosphate isomerase/epimerase
VEGRLFFDGDGARARAKLAEYGLEQGTISSGYASMPEIGRTLEYATAVGARFIMVSGVGDHQSEGLRAYEQSADLFNEVGRRCQAAGVQFCYHNHSWEFMVYDRATGRPIEGAWSDDEGRCWTADGKRLEQAVTGLDRLYEVTDPALVKANVDVFWVQHGGRNPAAFIQKYRDRIGYPHLKDLRYVGPEPRRKGRLEREEAEFVELGRGEVDFPSIWRALEPLNLPWVVYEQDRSTIPPGEAAAVSRRYLREALGI